MTTNETREQRFERLYVGHFDAVLGFAIRRTQRSEDAADATAETLLIAWRRLDHVPEGLAARPWLYGVARRVLANQHRGERRRTALGERLRRDLAAAWPDVAERVVHEQTVVGAMQRLSARDQEVLALHLWEGLAPQEICEVLGLPGAVVRPRLSRARARLRELLGEEPRPTIHPTVHVLTREIR